jgi:hypothetical protein
MTPIFMPACCDLDRGRGQAAGRRNSGGFSVTPMMTAVDK